MKPEKQFRVISESLGSLAVSIPELIIWVILFSL